MIRVILAATLLSVASLASAQEAGRVGLTMGYPAAFGVIWHVTDSLAVRPAVSFQTATSESTLSSTDTTSIGVDLAGLWYLSRWDTVRTYVSPRWAYAHSSSNISLLGDSFNSYGVIGAFGAECTLQRHFAVFAETGLAYSHSTTSSRIGVSPGQTSTVRNTSHGWANRTGAGVIVYF